MTTQELRVYLSDRYTVRFGSTWDAVSHNFLDTVGLFDLVTGRFVARSHGLELHDALQVAYDCHIARRASRPGAK